MISILLAADGHLVRAGRPSSTASRALVMTWSMKP
jgi:hypothetical protein